MTATATTEPWDGRSWKEILDGGVGSDSTLYCLLRAQGNSMEGALLKTAKQYGISHPVNIEQLAKRCGRAEEREGQRASEGATKIEPDRATWGPHIDSYISRRAFGESVESAVAATAGWFKVRHPANLARLEKQCALAEERLPKRGERDLGAFAGELTKELAELEQRRLELGDVGPGSPLASEYGRVAWAISTCRTRLEKVAQARRAQQESE